MMLVEAIVFIVVGILFCCSLSVDNIISYFLGTVLLLGGLITFGAALIERKTVMCSEGLSAAAMMTVGILCFIESLPFVDLLAMFLIVMGAFMLFDGLLGLALKKKAVPMIVELVLGAIIFTLGMCLWFIGDFRQYTEIVVGVIFIVIGVLLLTASLIYGNKKEIVAK